MWRLGSLIFVIGLGRSKMKTLVPSGTRYRGTWKSGERVKTWSMLVYPTTYYKRYENLLSAKFPLNSWKSLVCTPLIYLPIPNTTPSLCYYGSDRGTTLAPLSRWQMVIRAPKIKFQLILTINFMLSFPDGGDISKEMYGIETNHFLLRPSYEVIFIYGWYLWLIMGIS